MPSNSYEKPDYWSQKAFSEGYPARSVYKLKEIDEKFGMLKKKLYSSRPWFSSWQLDNLYFAPDGRNGESRFLRFESAC